ncbi:MULTISPECIES: hypothetical protein [Streptomyces]|uniref:hypothetical protein n=1 Tax=Streptomyces TaxID=1883 RepID=UPI001BDBE3DC|nr:MULTISPECIES: hypothetical protein [Streptomyces]MBT1100520.1 hypothetical protein [Streptomyces sp. Tu10]WTC61807.1 hypothetical protein OG865_04490 [Streptomyces anulatus]WUC85307.1 hypothetical protein OHQ35_04220 [Streptomyces anulatus]
MSTSDQDQHRDQREDGLNDEEPDRDQERDRGAGTPIADTAAETKTVAAAETKTVAAATTETDGVDGSGGEDRGDGQDGQDGQDGKRLTPRQARRLRIALSSVGMAAMAIVLGLRIASRSSVLVVGVYGLALILCGVVIELSRNGRTRLASWLLGAGLLAAVGADWLLLP